MAERDNEQLARRFYEDFWTRGNADAADDLVAEDLVHEQFPEGCPSGREGFKRLVRTWQAHEEPVLGLAYRPDGGRMASAGFDGTVRLWEAETGRHRAP